MGTERDGRSAHKRPSVQNGGSYPSIVADPERTDDRVLLSLRIHNTAAAMHCRRTSCTRSFRGFDLPKHSGVAVIRLNVCVLIAVQTSEGRSTLVSSYRASTRAQA